MGFGGLTGEKSKIKRCILEQNEKFQERKCAYSIPIPPMGASSEATVLSFYKVELGFDKSFFITFITNFCLLIFSGSSSKCTTYVDSCQSKDNLVFIRSFLTDDMT